VFQPQKKMFKVQSAIKKHNSEGSFWMRVGTAFVNKDGSINVYLDATPKTMEFTLFEYDENDLRKREERDANGPSNGGPRLGPPPYRPPTPAQPGDALPF
jgi:hypothetical protein